MTIVPVGSYSPDSPAYLNDQSTVATNVYPRDNGASGPLREPVVMMPVTTGEVLGATTMRHSDGTSYVIAGLADDFLVQVSLAWVGKGSAAYGTTREKPWRFAQFGDNCVAVSGESAVQNWPLGDAGDFVDLAAAAPEANFVATIEPGFLMLGNIYDGADRPSVLRWSAINDHTDWPTIGSSDAASKQSDEQELPNGGAIAGIAGAVGGAAGVVWTEKSIYRIEYVGAPTIFVFREIVRGSGCMCPNATIVVNGIAYYISEAGFQAFDGQAEREIGFGRVSRTFLDSVDRGSLYRVYVTVDQRRKVIVWAYPDTTAVNGHPNRWMIYNYVTDKWGYSDDPAILTQMMFPTISTPLTVDGLDAVLPGGIDASTFSVDSNLYAGGAQLLAGFNIDNEMVCFEGTTLAALVETGEADMQGRRAFVTGIRPLTDAITPTAALGYRERFADAVIYSPLTPLEATGICPQRVNTRYARARIYIPAGDPWTYLQGADVMMKQGGRR